MVNKTADIETGQEICRNLDCGKPVLVMAFRGTGVCSVTCRKDLGLDIPSTGTMMFVTSNEKQMIGELRGE